MRALSSSRDMLTEQWKTHDLVASAARNKIILINLEGSAKVSLHVKYDVFVNPFPPGRRGVSGLAVHTDFHSRVANTVVCFR